MKTYVFNREVKWGCGCAIVVAASKKKATEVLMERHSEDNWICEGVFPELKPTVKTSQVIFCGTYT